MAKPILIVRIPFDFPGDQIKALQDSISKSADDYHVFTLQTRLSEFTFEVLNVVDIKKDDLEKIIEDVKTAIAEAIKKN